MQETLSEHRVRAHVSRLLSSTAPVGSEPSAPVTEPAAERFKRLLKNPLILVGITWTVMAVLLAREIFGQ